MQKQKMQERKMIPQVSGYEWNMKWSEKDIDEEGWIRGSSLMHAFENIASAHVDSLNMGFDQMIAQNRIWVLTKIKYVIYKRAVPGARYHMGTYPHPKKAITFYRDFYLWDENGDVAAAAISQWCILNFKTRKPERTDTEVPGVCIDYEPFETGIEKIRWMPEEGSSPATKHLVTETDLDKNRHVNNSRYADMIDDAMNQTAHREVNIHFAKETVLGDEILLYTDGVQHVAGTLPDGTVVFKSLVKPQED